MNELELFHRCSYTAENEIAVLYFLHGLDDHFGRWNDLKEFVLNRNISFYAHDQRGHGKTELGIRAHVKDLNIFADDTIREIEEVKKQKPDTPIILMGHSMGGLIACMVAIKRPDLIFGSCLSAPCLKLSDDVSPIMRKLAYGIACIAPKFYLPWSSLDRGKLTPNLEQQEKDAEDPYIWHHGVRAGFGIALMKAIDETTANFINYYTPTFVFHGEFDAVCDFAGSKSLAETKPDLVQIVRYNYPYHSLFHLMPEESKNVMDDLYEKILELLKSASPGNKI